MTIGLGQGDQALLRRGHRMQNALGGNVEPIRLHRLGGGGNCLFPMLRHLQLLADLGPRARHLDYHLGTAVTLRTLDSWLDSPHGSGLHRFVGFQFLVIHGAQQAEQRAQQAFAILFARGYGQRNLFRQAWADQAGSRLPLR